MLEIIALLSLIGALIVLSLLAIIDLKTYLLPNKLVFTFFCLGILFHLCTDFNNASPIDMALGALIGSGSLYSIRVIANRIYKTDTLGLGDVKLMGAAGVWLGPYFILMALTAGALAGIIHGLALAILIWLKTKSWPNFNHLSLPAGPGFAAGILIASCIMLKDFPKELLS